MLTRCCEKGREKCDQYWPLDTDPLYYGDIKVQMLNNSNYGDWIITELIVCRGNEQRTIRHFHFITWPDFGVVPPQTLVRFVRAFRDRIKVDQRPVVVHCSAGVGRSGTFIALDRLLQQIKVCDFVDIFNIVYTMRKGKLDLVLCVCVCMCMHTTQMQLNSVSIKTYLNIVCYIFFAPQNVYGWYRPNHNTFVFISVCCLFSMAKRTPVQLGKSTIIKDMKVSSIWIILLFNLNAIKSP